MKFTKMHGLGNNYIYINLFEEPLEEATLPTLARRVSDVNTGIGSDGMILIGPSDRADFRMRIFNKDGSEGRNCGNGLRCVAKYVYDRGLTAEASFSVETKSGVVYVETEAAGDGTVRNVTVDMGEPLLCKKDLPMGGAPESVTVDEVTRIGDETYRITAVSMGNPHAVIRVDDLARVPLAVIGPQIECAPLFPERVNVEFIHVRKENEIDFRVWERGSGITQACGTGACAAVVAGVLNGWLLRNADILVHLDGGDLRIRWGDDAHVYMTGPAALVADGIYYE